MITKAQISYEFGEIQEELNSVSGKHVSYEDVLKRDTRLRELKNNMAAHLQLRPIEECTHDPATLLMQRFNLDIFWQKTMCVLHRKYIARARQNTRYAHSRRACVDASMEILRHQAQLYKESEPGGRMRTMKWFISSLTKHDFLLAAMIVCLDLNYDYISESLPEPPPNYDPYFWSSTQRADMLAALETSQSIWKESAAMTLGMLSGGLTPNSAAMFNAMAQSPGGTRYSGMDTNMGESSNSTGLTPNYGMDTSNPFGNINSVNSPFSVFGNTGSGIGMMDVPGNLDWDAWDSYIQNGANIDASFQFYPTNLDRPLNPDMQQQNQGGDNSGFGNNIFMGANTPGR